MSPLFTNWAALDHLFKSSDAVILSGYGMGNSTIALLRTWGWGNCQAQ